MQPAQCPQSKPAAGSKVRTRSRRCGEAVRGKPSRRVLLWPRLCTTPALHCWGCGVCEGLWRAWTCTSMYPLYAMTSAKPLVPPGTPHGLESAEQLRLFCCELFLGQNTLVPELG